MFVLLYRLVCGNTWGGSEKNRWFQLDVSIRCSDRLLEKETSSSDKITLYGEGLILIVEKYSQEIWVIFKKIGVGTGSVLAVWFC